MRPPLFPNFCDPVRRWRWLAPERRALVDRARGGGWSYRELDDEVDRWAAALRSAGIGYRDRVATLASNRREQVALFWGCLRVGAALVPLNWRLPAAELAPVLGDARPRMIFGESRFRAAAEEALRSAGMEPRQAPEWIDLDAELDRWLDGGGPARVEDLVIEPEDACLVLYTSGSTGRPKGAVIPYRQIFYNAVATTTAWELGPQDVAPISTPLFHTGGWNVFAIPLWHRGGTVVLFDGFDPDDYLDAIEREGITVALTVPTQLLLMRDRPGFGRALPALRFFISGGAPCPHALSKAVRAAGYAFREGYGLTECGPNCFAMSSEEAADRPGWVGRPVPFLEMRLVDAGGRDVPPGEIGELWLRGPQMFGGYLNDPGRTDEAVGVDGWLRTGDLAQRDESSTFRIAGRRKEMFISGGENVFPGEVEAALVECPGVAEAVVVGVPHDLWGEVGCAFVVSREGAGLTSDDVVSHARTRLAGYKVPKAVVLVDSLPRLGSGKADRSAVLRLARDVSLREAAPEREA